MIYAGRCGQLPRPLGNPGPRMPLWRRTGGYSIPSSLPPSPLPLHNFSSHFSNSYLASSGSKDYMSLSSLCVRRRVSPVSFLYFNPIIWLKWKQTWIFIGWASTKFVIFIPNRNSTMIADSVNNASWLAELSKNRLDRNHKAIGIGI
jgi:hypothetical protein